MTEDDYRDLIDLVTRLMDEAHCGDLADPKHYVVTRDSETFMLAPQKRLYEMLGAFDRHLALFDRAVFRRANERIREAGVAGWQGQVILELPREEAGARQQFNLAELPDLGETRKLLRKIMEDIAREDSSPTDPQMLA